MKTWQSQEITGVIVGVMIAAAGGLLILLPFLADMDMMAGGYALQFVGLFFILSGLVTAGIFGHRAARLNSIFSGKDLLAHWVYDRAQVERQAQRDRHRTKKTNLSLFLVMAGFLLACVVLFTVYGYASGQGDSMPWFIGGMVGVLLLLAAFASGMPYVQYRRAVRSSREAIIAANGLHVNGALHIWNTPLAALDGVSLVEDGAEARLVFHLRYRTGIATAETYTVEVPVPPGEEETARKVERYFREANQPA
ncbi:MAG: hypothetical protein JXM73_08290 [Anaerolineae bacterium]|nr:hypothetical protein [Anaerolineae bacterium]